MKAHGLRSSLITGINLTTPLTWWSLNRMPFSQCSIHYYWPLHSPFRCPSNFNYYSISFVVIPVLVDQSAWSIAALFKPASSHSHRSHSILPNQPNEYRTKWSNINNSLSLSPVGRSTEQPYNIYIVSELIMELAKQWGEDMKRVGKNKIG